LRHADARLEDIDPTCPRGLDRSLVLGLADCAWIRGGTNIPFTGLCGTGRSWIACALAHKVCIKGHHALHLRMPRLPADLRIAHGEGNIPKLHRDFVRMDLPVLDDRGRGPVDSMLRPDMPELPDDLFGRRSVISPSRLPAAEWHARPDDPTAAAAILDRLVHGACRIERSGPVHACGAGP